MLDQCVQGLGQPSPVPMSSTSSPSQSDARYSPFTSSPVSCHQPPPPQLCELHHPGPEPLTGKKAAGNTGGQINMLSPQAAMILSVHDVALLDHMIIVSLIFFFRNRQPAFHRDCAVYIPAILHRVPISEYPHPRPPLPFASFCLQHPPSVCEVYLTHCFISL